MLLNLLSKEEKTYFIDLLKKTIAIDGPINDVEKIVIAKLQAEMGEEIGKIRFSSLTTEKLIGIFWFNVEKNFVCNNTSPVALLTFPSINSSYL